MNVVWQKIIFLLRDEKFSNKEDVRKFCENCFEEKTSLEKHTKGMHRPTRQSRLVPLNCQVCEDGFEMRLSVRKHMQWMQVKKFGNEEDVCKFCDNSFEENKSFEKRTKKMHGEFEYDSYEKRIQRKE